MFTISITKFIAISICGFYKNRANSREPKKKGKSCKHDSNIFL